MMRLAAENLTVAYGNHPAVKGVSLSVEPGEIVALLGPNGSGKSTFLGALARVIPVKAGRITLGDRNLGSLSRLELARSLAVVPQGIHFAMPFTVTEAVFMGRFPHLGRFGRHRQEDKDMVRASLERVGLGRFGQRRVTALSGGEAQRVVIARALAQDTPVLLLDEPTSALDPGHSLDIVDLLRDLRDEGRTIVIAVHDVNMALSMADRLLFLRQGELVHGCRPEEVTPELLGRVYSVGWKVERLEGGRIVAFPWSKAWKTRATGEEPARG